MFNAVFAAGFKSLLVISIPLNHGYVYTLVTVYSLVDAVFQMDADASILKVASAFTASASTSLV